MKRWQPSLKNGEDEVRGYAAWALGSIGGEKTVAILKAAALKERNKQVLEEIAAAQAMVL